MYPKIEINLKKIIKNTKEMKKLCNFNGVSLSMVTKLLSDNKEVVEALVKNGVDCICDSRIQNLISYKNINAEKWLIRIPMLSEIKNLVKYVDVSLNSEIDVIKKINIECEKQRKKHKVILMYELGDLREGCMKNELENTLKQCLMLKNIQVYGIGVNLSCFGEILPTERNMKEFVALIDELERKHNIKFEIISGGNSSSYYMLKEGKLPRKINNLRLGESIFLGNVPCFDKPIKELNRDSFILKAEIIELKEKPSIPWGKRGYSNSFGEQMKFIDKGLRKRAIIALGKQDVKLDSIFPNDESIVVLGGSSDHIILDVTDCKRNYKVGDIIDFKLNYAGILTAFTSKYVERSII